MKGVIKLDFRSSLQIKASSTKMIIIRLWAVGCVQIGRHSWAQDPVLFSS